MTLEAGTLNRRIALERAVVASTGTGGEVTTWAPIATVWANLRYLNGAETNRADFTTASARASIRIRFRDDIDATCRALYTSNGKTTYFDIQAVLPDGAGRKFVDLAVEAGVNNG